MPIDHNLSADASIQIDAAPERVWDTLTNPEAIKQYLFGAETLTDWKVGSEIIFQGEYDGHRWQDKGRILEVVPYSSLKYSYWSGFCGLEDLPENYGTVRYNLQSEGSGTELNVSQVGYANEESQRSSAKAWPNVIAQIKSIAEASA